MKMKKRTLLKVNMCLFVAMLVIVLTYEKFYKIYDVLITIQTPFDLFIIPGMFYYWRYLDKQLKQEKSE